MSIASSLSPSLLPKSSPFHWKVNKQVLYWICQLAGWSILGLYTILINSAEEIQQGTVLDTFFTVSSLMLLSHVYRFAILRLGWLKIIFAKLILRILGASFLLALLATPISLLSSFLFNQANLEASLSSEGIYLNIITVTITYFGWSLCYFLYHYVTNYNRNLKWEALINEFELNQLKSQLNPHFIFNALNSVKALVDEDPKKAKESINQLSNILRNSLMMDKKKVIPFDEEMAIVKDYLALECTRYEERLRVAYDFDPASSVFKIPPMMLQTIVENGVKHGISKIKGGGLIHIRSKVIDQLLHVEIRNSGKYQPAPDRVEGYGISSTRQRLDLLFHQKASFKIGNTPEGEVLTEIILPRWDESELMVSNLRLES